MWKILSRTIQSIFGIAGLVMEAFGIYFSIVQIANEPKGPFGWSILVWGVILFTIFAVSVIIQLWWHINRVEDSYLRALSFDRPGVFPNRLNGNVALKLSNGIDKPVAYIVDMGNTFINADGNIFSGKGYCMGGILAKLQNAEFALPYKILPIMQANQIIFHSEVIYGCPDKLAFRQVREMKLSIKPIGDGDVSINYLFTKVDDRKLKIAIDYTKPPTQAL